MVSGICVWTKDAGGRARDIQVEVRKGKFTIWVNKDMAIWCGATSVLLSWVLLSKAIGDMPIVGNWVYMLSSTVKKLVAFLNCT